MDLLTWPDGPENPKIFKRFYSESAYEWHYGVNPVIRLKANPLIPQVGTPYPTNRSDGHGVCENVK